MRVYYHLRVSYSDCDEFIAACANSETGVSYQPGGPPWERKVV